MCKKRKNSLLSHPGNSLPTARIHVDQCSCIETVRQTGFVVYIGRSWLHAAEARPLFVELTIIQHHHQQQLSIQVRSSTTAWQHTYTCWQLLSYKLPIIAATAAAVGSYRMLTPLRTDELWTRHTWSRHLVRFFQLGWLPFHALSRLRHSIYHSYNNVG